jgi:hypothetical protein
MMKSFSQVASKVFGGLLIMVVIAAMFIFLIKVAPRVKKGIGELFVPTISRMDRAIIGGCKSVLASGEIPSEKAAHLIAMHCERYSDQQIAQIDRDIEKCIQNVSMGDTVLNRCLEAANGY